MAISETIFELFWFVSTIISQKGAGFEFNSLREVKTCFRSSFKLSIDTWKINFNFDEKNPKLNENINNTKNKLCYAALAEGKFNSYSYNRVAIKDTANPNALKLKSSKNPSKILVVGNGTFLKNSYRIISSKNGPRPDFKGFNELKMNSDDVSLNVNRVIGNQDFFLNIVDYIIVACFGSLKVMGTECVFNFFVYNMEWEEVYSSHRNHGF